MQNNAESHGQSPQIDPDEAARDRLAIRDLLENWVIWRDSGDWERFATVWHDDARMNATWFRSTAAEFIVGCKRAFDAGMVAIHSLGATSIDLLGSRAVAQSRMQIIQRGTLEGIEVDVTCSGRFVDALEKRQGRWGMVLRQPVYELDRMTPVHGAQPLVLDRELLDSFPVGYRHLAYLQAKSGLPVYNDLPGTRGEAISALHAGLSHWLGGGDDSCLG